MTTENTITDRELLELAAKAAGYDNPSNDDDIWREIESSEDRQWNPLTDDGDALRLAVKLGIDLTLHGTVFTHPYTHSEISPTFVINGDNWFGEDAKTNRQDDILAATRRVIVRAAAEIGKDMK